MLRTRTTKVDFKTKNKRDNLKFVLGEHENQKDICQTFSLLEPPELGNLTFQCPFISSQTCRIWYPDRLISQSNTCNQALDITLYGIPTSFPASVSHQPNKPLENVAPYERIGGQGKDMQE